MSARRGEPDYAPLLMAGFVGIAGLGIFASIEIYKRLRAARPTNEPTPTPPAPPGEPTS
jgi:hypothetical protein